jgi:hypothetical protein
VNAWDETFRRPGVGHWNDSTKLDVLLGWSRNGAEIMYWRNYGAVCPDVVTTNGDVWLLLKSHGAPTRLTPPGAAFFLGRFLWGYLGAGWR